MNCIAGCACSAWARGLKHLKKWREAWFLGSDHNFAASEAKHPKGEPKARGICALTPKTPDPESLFRFRPFPVRVEPVEALRRIRDLVSLMSPMPLCRRGGRLTCLSLRQEKVSKEKATLVPASLRFATGNLRCSVQPGSRANSPAAQTSTSPFPSGPALLGAFTRGGGYRIREPGGAELTAR